MNKRKEKIEEILKTIENLNIEYIFVDSTKSEFIEMCKEELISLVLKDYFDLNCDLASEIMKLSKATYWRALNSARKKIATALVEGKNIKIKEKLSD